MAAAKRPARQQARSKAAAKPRPRGKPAAKRSVAAKKKAAAKKKIAPKKPIAKKVSPKKVAKARTSPRPKPAPKATRSAPAKSTAKTIVLYPEAAFGPALNCVGIAQRLKAKGYKPEGAAAQMIAEAVGPDLRTAASEVDKLAAYVG